jgi:hypothetical protein
MIDWQQDDWISAYLDDEMSPEERELAQLKIAGDPELQGQVEKLQQLGNRLRRLPTHRLPASFAASIRQQIQGISETPELDSVRVSRATPSTRESQQGNRANNTRDRGKLLALVVLGTLAASLLVSVALAPSLWQSENARTLAEATDAMVASSEADQLSEVEVDASMEDSPGNAFRVRSAPEPEAMSEGSSGGGPLARSGLDMPQGGSRTASDDGPTMDSMPSPGAMAGGGFGGQGQPRPQSLGAAGPPTDIRTMRAGPGGGLPNEPHIASPAGQLLFADNPSQAEWFASLAIDQDQDLDRFLQTIADSDFEFDASLVVSQSPFAGGAGAGEVSETPEAVREEGNEKVLTGQLLDFQKISQAELEQNRAILIAVEGTPLQIEQLVQKFSDEPRLTVFQQTWKAVTSATGANPNRGTGSSGEFRQSSEVDPSSSPKPSLNNNGEVETQQRLENQEIASQPKTVNSGGKEKPGTVRFARESEWKIRLLEKTRQRAMEPSLDQESTQGTGDGNISGQSPAGGEGPATEPAVALVEDDNVAPASPSNSKTMPQESVAHFAEPRMKLFIVIVSKDLENK